jgi:predicted nucleic acid-binding protein
MIAVDSGFLYALADADDAWHAQALTQRHTVQDGWVTTWPVLAEACHLMGRRLGPPFVAALVDDVAAGTFGVWNPPVERLAEIPLLMRKYADLPMDLADATLVLLAQHLDHGRILSTDCRDFRTYRWKSRKPFHNLLEKAP